MASIQTNISKGREVELYERVNSNDPANSALIMLVLATGSANGVGGIVDFDTVAAITAGGYTEVTNVNYARKTLTDADLAAWTPDDTNNWILLVLPLQTFTNITAGNSWDIVVVAYDPDTTGGTDTTLVPITASELRDTSGNPIVPAANNILVNFSNAWLYAR
jgi:hypothetical protein